MIGNNEEFERNSRLLIPYRERLKCQKEVAESHTTQSNQHEEKVTTHHIGTVETSEQGVDRNSINDNTILSSEEILYSRTASDQPEKVSLRISHKAEKLISHVTADETEKQQSNLSVDQANEEIKEMLNSEVDFNDKNEYATLLLWDFAGDKEFYHTHQTFLSPDSIYVVVTNLNEADNKEAQGIFRLWMDSIHCYCRPNEFSYISNNDTKSISEDPFDPPVILVGTWKDQVQNPAGEEIMDVCHESLYKFAEDVSEDACRHIRDEYTHFVSNTDDDDTAF
ncbi:unnamed protein product [Mytilus edulis]|uniref:Roc domain-containing protein n=1 Tax=Mytilus edulis TaxID=6550 RepID=A0A8S3PXS3_MYTED|nr:unnamed protein product [Mytilus edulis]